jgi:hypothetical protein
MTIRVAEDHIKPSGLPMYCSSCFNQQPNLKHIDFDAACDRGFYGGENSTRITMDDLVLCEECIGEAARFLDWMPASEIKAALRAKDERIDRLEKDLKKAQRYAGNMEEVLYENKIKLHSTQKPRAPKKEMEPVNG